MIKWTSLVLCLVAACGSSPGGDDDCVDNDGDGVTTCDGDCDDGDALSNPLSSSRNAEPPRRS